MAFEAEARIPPGMGEGWPFVHLDFGSVPHGYGWIFPKGTLVSIGICAFTPSKGMKLRSRLERFVGCVDYIRGGKVERACFHPLATFSGGNMLASRGRVLLVGDAAKLMDPMTGEGISYAIRSGHMAGEAIVKAITEGHEGIRWYQEALRRTLFQDLGVALRLAKVVYRFPKVAYTVMKSSEDLRLLYLDILVGNARYEHFSRKMADGLRRALGGKISAMVDMSSPGD
jgi:flavin-dependent dehydrogenase